MARAMHNTVHLLPEVPNWYGPACPCRPFFAAEPADGARAKGTAHINAERVQRFIVLLP